MADMTGCRGGPLWLVPWRCDNDVCLQPQQAPPRMPGMLFTLRQQLRERIQLPAVLLANCN